MPPKTCLCSFGGMAIAKANAHRLFYLSLRKPARLAPIGVVGNLSAHLVHRTIVELFAGRVG